MKIAFDENMPELLVAAMVVLAGSGYTIESAKLYTKPNVDDDYWVKNFHGANGKVIISGER